MKLILPILLFMLVNCTEPTAQDTQNSMSTKTVSKSSTNEYIKLSQDFLISLKNGESGEVYVTKYGEIDLDHLVESLDSKAKKMSFWINTYNALVQYRLVPHPELFDDRDAFFNKPWVNIAGVLMSYDDIEHGIIRNSRVKLGLGIIKDPFVPKWERQLRNTEIDGRAHFTLNCGAKSCPYIAVLNDEGFDAQMNALSKDYLSQITEVDGSIVKTSPLFSWFRGDFGGKRGIKSFLMDLGVTTSTEVDLEFLGYDWTVETGNYTEI